jgi:amino-acid N-acetyltransferase
MTPLQLVTPTRPAPVEPLALEALVFRAASVDDAAEIHALIVDHQAEGHLLPRTLADVRRWASRFVVACAGDQVVACGELAPLGNDVAEIRSLVVDRAARRHGVGEQVFVHLKARAESLGLARLCAFTHEPRYFIRLGFSIVPHTWLPEKIATDCCGCPLFRRCGQFGMLMELASSPRYRTSLYG